MISPYYRCILAALVATAITGCATPRGAVMPEESKSAKVAGAAATREEVSRETEPTAELLSQLDRVREILAGGGGPAAASPVIEARHLTEVLPSHPYPWILLGIASLRDADVGTAEDAFLRASALDPENPDVLIGLAEVAEEQGRLEDAKKLYAASMRSSDDPAVAVKLSYLHLVGGQPDVARQILLSSAGTHSDDPVAVNNLAVSLERSGMTGEALEVLNSAEVDSVDLLRTRAVIQLREGRPESANEIVERLADGSDAGDRETFLLGLLAYQQRRLDSARKLFNQVIIDSPGSSGAYINLGLTYRRMGRFREAEETYLEGIARADHPDLHLNLGVLLELYLDRPDQAIDHYRKYLDLGGQGTVRVQGWVDYLAGIVETEGDTEK